jgi:hypothetical protein
MFFHHRVDPRLLEVNSARGNKVAEVRWHWREINLPRVRARMLDR